MAKGNSEDESDDEAVSDTFYGGNTNEEGYVAESAVDITGTDSSIPFPPGFTPDKGMANEVEQDMQVEQEQSHSKYRIRQQLDDTMERRGSLGNSGGILCTWDPNVFQKEHHIISDNFVALCGNWIPNQKKILMISVYAPQAVSNKRVLWTYLTSLINRWNGESIVMGDFNEVRRMEERWGFQLEGYTFTWAHPSATKMSKLDRFLVTDGLLSLFPHVSAACLDRHLSDHRPILLREVFTDYGATPFRFYHSWILDQGGVNDDLLLSRTECMNIFKIKRANIAVKGIMIDRDWVDDPSRVKDEFRNHFAARFQDPGISVCFLQNRQILDGPFIINELLARCHHKKQRAMVFKVDFAKAYDSIRWDYLEDVLHSFGFGSKWRSWIRGCLNSGMASILVNGSPTSKFQFHSGLGSKGIPSFFSSPLAPYLFILVMESLHLSFTRVIEAGIFTGVRIDPSTMISHLFYADDVVFIGEWSQDNLKGIMHSLRCFSLLSGLSINIKKSHLLGVGIPASYVNEAVSCRIFLTSHFLHNASHSSTWSSIVKEINILKTQGIDIISHCKIRVGNGRSTSFWNDLWIGDSCFRYKFPRLYALDINKECTVADKMVASFTSSFRREVRGGTESLQLTQIIDLLGTVILSNMEDRWIWDLNGNGEFCVKDVRNLLEVTFLPKADSPTRWIKTIPIKVNIFAWKVSLDRLPTRSNLARRGVLVPSSSCLICNVSNEDLAHLLFRCDLAIEVTRLVYKWWNLVWIPLDSYISWLSWIKALRMNSRSKSVLAGVFLGIGVLPGLIPLIVFGRLNVPFAGAL
ncbi:RNA-directed DNA polymerase, eukaryota [Tanacetum coccineum]